jgi:hypothetical protein
LTCCFGPHVFFSGSAQPLALVFFFVIFIVKCEKKLMMKSSKVIGPSKSIEGHAAERKMLAHSLRYWHRQLATHASLELFHKTHAEQGAG